MTFSLHSRADVASSRPARWAKQLSSHLSNKVEVVSSPRGSEVTIGSGLGVIRAEAEVIVLEAHADDAETLARVEDVLGRHLTRFGEKDGLVVEWMPSSGGSGR